MANHPSSPIVDPVMVRAALESLFEPSMCFEVRALNASFSRGRSRPVTISGYFNDLDKATEWVTRIQQASGIYVTLNPVMDCLLARAANRLKVADKSGLTSDRQISKRRWLPIDIDPKRESGISSTDHEIESAEAISAKIVGFLEEEEGWPCPLLACSGNGFHLLYRIDEPADDDGLVRRVITRLASLFSQDACSIDESVFNPARIWKLYGTMACKGDSTEDRPHRWSELCWPKADGIVTHEQLVAFAGPAPAPAPKQSPQAANRTTGYSGQSGGELKPFDIDGFIQRHGLELDGPHEWHGANGTGRKWAFRHSPMCDHHGDGPYLVQHATGAISASCHHNSCSWNWHDLRAKLEPRPAPRQAYDTCPIDVYADSECSFQPPDEPSISDVDDTQGPPKNRHVVEVTTLSDSLYKKIDSLRANEEVLFTTGLPEVDGAISGGVAAGEVVVIGARPSHGKSALALQMIHHMSLQGRKCLIISEEMTTSMLAGRSLAFISELPAHEWQSNTGVLVREVSSYLSSRTQTLVATGCNTVQRAIETIRHHVKQSGVDTVFIDYLQLLTSNQRGSYEAVSYASQQIQKATIELGIVSVVLAQLNRQITSRERFIPRMSDLRDSGQIESDAHVILFGVWPWKEKPDEPKERYQIYVAKNKEREIVRPMVEICFEAPRQRFLRERPTNNPFNEAVWRDSDDNSRWDDNGGFDV